MLSFTSLHADIVGDVSSAGYALGALGVAAVATTLFFGIRLFLATKRDRAEKSTDRRV